jgi:ribulose-5-phosphate 4-epimerase/fuculose-1-phosphate aldolase
MLVTEGQDDFTPGHLSVRLPDDPSRFFMKAHSLGLDEVGGFSCNRKLNSVVARESA